MKKLMTLIACSFLVGCGEDVGPRELGQTDGQSNANQMNNTREVQLALACEDDETPVGLEGSVFFDTDDQADSSYVLPQPDAREAMPGVEVRLRNDVGDEWSTQTCDDGSFRFAELDDDRRYIVDVIVEGRATSVNDSVRAFDAVSEASLDLVVFGDSIPVFGGTPWFPNVMRRSLQDFGEVNLTNVAVPGSKSIEWLPGDSYFDSSLDPLLDDADVIVFSLGGNDLQEFAFSLQTSPDPISKVGELQPLVDEIKANLKIILAELRAKAPTADIVWILYPNYARSTEWELLLGNFASAGLRIVEDLLEDVRNELAEEPDLILIDMLAATAEVPLDPLLDDPLHLNSTGHEFYANEILETLGFVDVDDPRRYDFAVEP